MVTRPHRSRWVLILASRPDGPDGAGAQLGSGQVGIDAAGTARCLFCRAEVANHALPSLGIVVRAVDAHDVHARYQQPMHQFRIRGGLAGHGDHDTGPALAGARTGAQQGAGVCVQVHTAGLDTHGAMGPVPAVGQPGQGAQGVQHCVDAAADMGLDPAKAAQPQQGKILLHVAQVTLAQGQVVEQIAGAVLVPGMDVVHFRLMHVGQAQNVCAQAFQGRDEVIADVWDGQVHGVWGRYSGPLTNGMGRVGIRDGDSRLTSAVATTRRLDCDSICSGLHAVVKGRPLTAVGSQGT